MVIVTISNCENSFFRYNFKERKKATKKESFLVNELAFDLLGPEEKVLTGAFFDNVDSNIIALQEIESHKVLDHFDFKFMTQMDYEYEVLIDGHDPRQIDVAVLSKHPIVSVRINHNEGNS